jgi:hypothetical protein
MEDSRIFPALAHEPNQPCHENKIVALRHKNLGENLFSPIASDWCNRIAIAKQIHLAAAITASQKLQLRRVNERNRANTDATHCAFVMLALARNSSSDLRHTWPAKWTF